EQDYVIVNRGPRELERSGQITDVKQTRRLARGECQKARQDIERADTRKIAHVTLDLTFDQIAIPRAPARGPAACKRRRIAACDDALGKSGAEPFGNSGTEPPRE